MKNIIRNISSTTLVAVLSMGIFISIVFGAYFLLSPADSNTEGSHAALELEYVENIEDDKIKSVSEVYPIKPSFFYVRKHYFVTDEKGANFLVEMESYGPELIFSHKSQEVKEDSEMSKMLDEAIEQSKK